MGLQTWPDFTPWALLTLNGAKITSKENSSQNMNPARVSDTTALINTSLTATLLQENKQLMDKAFPETPVPWSMGALQRGAAQQSPISDPVQKIIGISYKEGKKRGLG